jgi:phenylacetate-CoA ligase
MQSAPLGARIARGAKGQKINTGGTSGEPLEFLVGNDAFAREWAHMHHVWKARGYRPWHLKLTLRGKHFGRDEVLRYNAVHNELVANANCSMSEVVSAVLALPRGLIVRWVHGYPSLVAEFAHALDARPPRNVSDFRGRLYGVLLGSEFPADIYRSPIEQILTCNVVSWYGHSEMSILAGEQASGIYESMSTYGYAEAADSHLIGTSLHNFVHPFIRYDTGDVVEALPSRSGSLAFRVGEGRIGEFVCDRSGNRHALTAVIFGRHHPAFERIRHVQVRDDGGGCVALLVTPRSPQVDVESIRAGFHLEGLDIDWRIQLVDAPVRTGHGKIRLKVS